MKVAVPLQVSFEEHVAPFSPSQVSSEIWKSVSVDMSWGIENRLSCNVRVYSVSFCVYVMLIVPSVCPVFSGENVSVRFIVSFEFIISISSIFRNSMSEVILMSVMFSPELKS